MTGGRDSEGRSIGVTPQVLARPVLDLMALHLEAVASAPPSLPAHPLFHPHPASPTPSQVSSPCCNVCPERTHLAPPPNFRRLLLFPSPPSHPRFASSRCTNFCMELHKQANLHSTLDLTWIPGVKNRECVSGAFRGTMQAAVSRGGNIFWIYRWQCCTTTPSATRSRPSAGCCRFYGGCGSAPAGRPRLKSGDGRCVLGLWCTDALSWWHSSSPQRWSLKPLGAALLQFMLSMLIIHRYAHSVAASSCQLHTNEHTLVHAYSSTFGRS